MSMQHIFFVFLITYLCWLHKPCSCNIAVLESMKFTDGNLISAIKSIVEAKPVEEITRLKIYIHFDQRFPKLKYYYYDLIRSLFYQKLQCCSMTISYHIPIEYSGVPHYVIILIDNYESLSYLYQNLQENGSGTLAYIIIIMRNIRDPYDTDMKLTLSLLWHMSIVNVGILIQIQPENIVMISYKPFDYQMCKITQPLIVNRFDANATEWISKDYFPSKLKNFYGCSLVCATWEDMPYLEVQKGLNGEIVGFKGIEGELLKFMAGNLNFSVDLYILNQDEVEQTFNESGLIFKEIFGEHADYALGGFQYRLESLGNSTFSQSSYYYLSSIYFVTNLLNVYSSYEKLAMPLDPRAWIGIICVFLCGYVIIFACGFLNKKWRHFILGTRQGTRISYYYMFVLLLGGTKAVLPNRNFARYLLGLWLLSTLVLRNIYQSGMYQMLRDNRKRDPPETIDAVMKQNYNITITSGNVRYLTYMPFVEKVHVLKYSELDVLPYIAKLNRKSAIIIPYEYFGYFRKIDTLSYNLHLVRERIFTQPLSFVMSHNSYLVSVFNEQILKAENYGFSTVWSSNLVESVENAGDAVDNNIDVTTNMKNVLSFEDIKSIFMILIWLHLCSTVIFLLELIMRKHLQSEKRFYQRLHLLLLPDI